MITKDNKDDRRRVEKALEATGLKFAKVRTKLTIFTIECIKVPSASIFNIT